jgi:hypothetical protein
MKQIKFPKQTFIAGGYIDKNLCDEIIEHHKNFRHRAIKGLIGYQDKLYVDTEIKESLDLTLNTNNKLMQKYNLELIKVLKIYCKKYSWVNQLETFSNMVESTNIQYYKPNNGFKKWHQERYGKTSSSRELVFMTYLNDVPKGGTEFYYQNLKIEAKKGLTIIWPSDWTHLHRGIISEKYEKYIVTGWFNFV